ncbi:MAG: Ppx/GppA family phosphatase [Alphaproteobacteria bacterium]|nr:Ppx/GppA family phosphatase [Alphaproteobacteria bacterium]
MKKNSDPTGSTSQTAQHIAAIDLGSNTCRLLIARLDGKSYKIVDSFSRVVRLGAGLKNTGNLSDMAMTRALEALKICAGKIELYENCKIRAVATEACRQALNKDSFIEKILHTTGIPIEIISEFEEARLSLLGCSGLSNPNFPHVLGFDIGGCSTEVMWAKNTPYGLAHALDWISIPYGIVSLLDSCAGDALAFYEEIREKICLNLNKIRDCEIIENAILDRQVQIIGSSGTTTTIAAMHLKLNQYDRNKVDGSCLPVSSLHQIAENLKTMTHQDRFLNSHIGPRRSDTVIAGLAILQGICDTWPIETITVADRGVRDGILSDMLIHLI